MIYKFQVNQKLQISQKKKAKMSNRLNSNPDARRRLDEEQVAHLLSLKLPIPPKLKRTQMEMQRNLGTNYYQNHGHTQGFVPATREGQNRYPAQPRTTGQRRGGATKRENNRKTEDEMAAGLKSAIAAAKNLNTAPQKYTVDVDGPEITLIEPCFAPVHDEIDDTPSKPGASIAVPTTPAASKSETKNSELPGPLPLSAKEPAVKDKEENAAPIASSSAPAKPSKGDGFFNKIAKKIKLKNPLKRKTAKALEKMDPIMEHGDEEAEVEPKMASPQPVVVLEPVDIPEIVVTDSETIVEPVIEIAREKPANVRQKKDKPKNEEPEFRPTGILQPDRVKKRQNQAAAPPQQSTNWQFQQQHYGPPQNGYQHGYNHYYGQPYSNGYAENWQNYPDARGRNQRPMQNPARGQGANRGRGNENVRGSERAARGTQRPVFEPKNVAVPTKAPSENGGTIGVRQDKLWHVMQKKIEEEPKVETADEQEAAAAQCVDKLVREVIKAEVAARKAAQKVEKAVVQSVKQVEVAQKVDPAKQIVIKPAEPVKSIENVPRVEPTGISYVQPTKKVAQESVADGLDLTMFSFLDAHDRAEASALSALNLDAAENDEDRASIVRTALWASAQEPRTLGSEQLSYTHLTQIAQHYAAMKK
ncbi:unnamed protein product, partial [Mesorhabditis spiculigera]